MTSGSANAGLIITFVPSTLAPIQAGSTSEYIDVMIRSDNQDKLTGFLGDIIITGATGADTWLTFTPTQTNNFVNFPNYVFNGVSSQSPVSTAIAGSPPADNIFDYSSGDAVELPLLTEFILARLELTADLNASTGNYTISFSNVPPQFFVDGPDPIITAGSANVSILAAPSNPVPEPSSMILMLCASSGLVMFRRLKARKKKEVSL
jgi:hypothetical protein